MKKIFEVEAKLNKMIKVIEEDGTIYTTDEQGFANIKVHDYDDKVQFGGYTSTGAYVLYKVFGKTVYTEFKSFEDSKKDFSWWWFE